MTETLRSNPRFSCSSSQVDDMLMSIFDNRGFMNIYKSGVSTHYSTKLLKAIQYIALNRILSYDLEREIERITCIHKYTFSDCASFVSYVKHAYLAQQGDAVRFDCSDERDALNCFNELKFGLIERGNTIVIKDSCYTALKFQLITKDSSHFTCVFVNRTSDLIAPAIDDVDYIFCQFDDFISPTRDEYSDFNLSQLVGVYETHKIVDDYVRKYVV